MRWEGRSRYTRQVAGDVASGLQAIQVVWIRQGLLLHHELPIHTVVPVLYTFCLVAVKPFGFLHYPRLTVTVRLLVILINMLCGIYKLSFARPAVYNTQKQSAHTMSERTSESSTVCIDRVSLPKFEEKREQP